MSEIFISSDNGQQGPYDIKQLRALWAKGVVKPDTFFWRKGEAEWKPLKTIASELDKDSAPPTIRMTLPAAKKRQVVAKLAQKHQRTNNVEPISKKKKLFIYLGIGLGLLGVHNFYLGYRVKGGAQLVVSLGFIAAGVLVTPVFFLGLIGVYGWVATDLLMTQRDVFGESLEE